MRQRVLTFTGLVLALVVAFAGAAAASEVVEDVVEGDDAALMTPEVTTVWDDEAGAIVIAVGETEDGGDPCEGVTVERVDGELVVVVGEEPPVEDAPWFGDAPASDDGAASDEVELPPGCFVYDGTADDGKVNSGTLTSAVASQLSPHDLDVPKGWIMREVAKVKPTKVKAKDVEEDAVGAEDRDADEDDPAESEVKDERAKDKGIVDKGATDKTSNGKAKGHEKADKAKGKRGG